jgi:predicted ATPase
VWPGLLVTDSSLAQAVSDVRSALGPAGRDLVKTIARRGYLLATEAGAAQDAERVVELPTATACLFGREAELDDLRTLLAKHRLVTVVGAGGIGKTMLALAAARTRAAEAGTRAAWVDMARVADPVHLPAALSHALGLPITQGGNPLPGLTAALRRVTALVVLDNAEHLIDAVAHLARAILDAAPNLRLLVTSQAMLHIGGEQVFRVGALDVPVAGAPPEQAAQAGAVAMFVDQARAMDHRFELTADNVGTVVRLCARLQGIPLAIRLATARLPLLGLAGLEARLNERLQWLSDQRRDVPPRQRTLLGALAWSYGLLSLPQQTLFRQLSVFVSGFTLELAAAVDAPCDESVADRLGTLVERSLVELDRGPPARYRLLESQRDFGWRELAADGDAQHIANRRHAQAMANALRSDGAPLWSRSDADWLSRWGNELDNVRAALDWSQRHDATLFVALMGASQGLFRLRDVGHELRQRAASMDVGRVACTPSGLQTCYWLSLAFLQAGVSSRAMYEFSHQAEQLARETGECRLLYLALCQRGISGLVPPNEAASLLQETVSLEWATVTVRERAQRRAAEFAVYSADSRWEQAHASAEAGFALSAEAGTRLLQGVFGNWIVLALMNLGDVEAATQRSQQLGPAIALGPISMTIPFVGKCARCAFMQGDLEAARQQLAQMFTMCRSVAWQGFDSFGDLYVQLVLADGRADDATRLLGYASSVSRTIWHAPQSGASLDYARRLLVSRASEERVRRLCIEGEGLSRDAVCALILGDRPAP